MLTWQSQEVKSLSRAEQSRAEQSRAEQSRAEQSRAEASSPCNSTTSVTAQTHVTGRLRSQSEESNTSSRRVEDNRYQNEIRIGNIYGFTGGNYAGMVYDKRGLCPALNCMGGGNRQPMIVEAFNESSRMG